MKRFYSGKSSNRKSRKMKENEEIERAKRNPKTQIQ